MILDFVSSMLVLNSERWSYYSFVIFLILSTYPLNSGLLIKLISMADLGFCMNFTKDSEWFKIFGLIIEVFEQLLFRISYKL